MSSVTTEIEAHTPPAVDGTPYELSADTFLAMIEEGFFPEEARVYLEDGKIYEKMAKSNAHGMVATVLAIALMPRLPAGWFLATEGQFKLDPKNSPLPDIAVIRGDPRVYFARDRRPNARDMGLVIEIAVTSLVKDLGPNLERHARARVPNYWVADVGGRRIIAHSRPRVSKGRGAYDLTQIVQAGDVLPLVLDGVEVVQFTYEELMP